MSGPVFAIRVPPRLQEVISPTIKDVKSSGQHAKNRRRKVGMRVRMTGAGREYVWGRIGTMTSVYRLSASLESCSDSNRYVRLFHRRRRCSLVRLLIRDGFSAGVK